MWEDACGKSWGDEGAVICGNELNRELKKESMLPATKIRFENTRADDLSLYGVYDCQVKTQDVGP